MRYQEAGAGQGNRPEVAFVGVASDETSDESKPVDAPPPTGFRALIQQGRYSLYVLFILVVVYLLNQLDRYTIAIVKSEAEKDNVFNETEYQLLAGPIFTLVFTFSGIVVGVIADRANRRNILAICLLIWSLSTAAMGLSKEFWQIALGRMGVGLGESGCNPLANGLISDYFTAETRGTALGVYNWGIYIGYSMAYGLGNAITDAYGYRAFFYVAGLAGVPVAALLFFTVKEPARGNKDAIKTAPKHHSLLEVLKFYVSVPSLFLLCLAGAVRNSAGYVWAYNTQPYYEDYTSKAEIAEFMGWIPLVGGVMGATFGGFISDRVIKTRGSWARMYVLIISQLAAAPFALGAILLPVPTAFFSSMICSIIGEMWVGVLLAVVTELVPATMRVTATAVYFFIITNIAGAATLLVGPIKHAWSYRAALVILFPGLYVASAVFFFFTLGVLRRDLEAAKEKQEQQALLESSQSLLIESPDKPESYGAADRADSEDRTA